jgi:hypothetical protein
MSLSTLIVLANIYNLPAAQLIRSVSPGIPLAGRFREFAVLNVTGRALTPNHITILPADNGIVRARFERGVIGKGDLTLDPWCHLVQLFTSTPKIASFPDVEIGLMCFIVRSFFF